MGVLRNWSRAALRLRSPRLLHPGGAWGRRGLSASSAARAADDAAPGPVGAADAGGVGEITTGLVTARDVVTRATAGGAAAAATGTATTGRRVGRGACG